MKRAVVFALVAACHGGGGAHDRGGGGGAARTGVVHRADLIDRVLLTGELRAASSVELTVPRTESWELPIRWMAEDGTAVKAGDKVLEFDNSSFTSNRETKHIAALEAAMTFRTYQDTSAMETADKDVAFRESVVAQEKAKLKADVPADLMPARTAQENALAKKRADVEVSKAEQDLAAQRAEASIEQHVKQIELDKAQRAVDDAEKTIAELVLTAPRDGVIVVGDHPWEGRKFQVGDTVQAGWTIVTLPNLGDAMEVRSELNGVDDGRVSIGMVGTCTLDAYPDKPLPCTVKDLTPVARSKGKKSLRRSFAVVLTLSHADQQTMRPGMSVKIELHREPLRNALVVPRGAVVFADVLGDKAGAPPTTSVHVTMAGGASREVALGPCDAQVCVVERGLVDGDSVEIGGAP